MLELDTLMVFFMDLFFHITEDDRTLDDMGDQSPSTRVDHLRQRKRRRTISARVVQQGEQSTKNQLKSGVKIHEQQKH